MGLTQYKRKRNFARTSEPKGGKPLPRPVRGASRFVIQKHDASRLHYDFRLQMEGVLKSWALPKGLPWKQGEKHLAVEVEDHPIEYENFEGVIPQGNYGGGTVMVWDRGTYYVYGEQPLQSLRDGKLHLVLDGEKAKGEWALIRIRGNEEKNQWLILKAGSSAKPISKKRDDQSVKSGRTMKQIAKDRDAEWESDRDRPESRSDSKLASASHKKKVCEQSGNEPRARKQTSASFGSQLKGLPAAKARFIEPMKPRILGKAPPSGDWVYELKFDGIRAIAVKIDNKVSLVSRNGNDLGARFPEIVAAVKNLPVAECVIDGEVVALDEEGRSSFQLLQAREMLATGRVRPTGGEGKKSPIYFYVFDLLQLEGKSLISLPLEQRKKFLEQLCADAGEPIRFSGEIGGNAEALLAEVKRRGLEGIVGKQRNS